MPQSLLNSIARFDAMLRRAEPSSCLLSPIGGGKRIDRYILKCKQKFNEKKNTDAVTYTSVTEDEDQSNLNSVKADTAETMRERHKEAQKEMGKSVDNIFNGAGSNETKNEEAKKKMFEDLDNI